MHPEMETPNYLEVWPHTSHPWPLLNQCWTCVTLCSVCCIVVRPPHPPVTWYLLTWLLCYNAVYLPGHIYWFAILLGFVLVHYSKVLQTVLIATLSCFNLYTQFICILQASWRTKSCKPPALLFINLWRIHNPWLVKPQVLKNPASRHCLSDCVPWEGFRNCFPLGSHFTEAFLPQGCLGWHFRWLSHLTSWCEQLIYLNEKITSSLCNCFLHSHHHIHVQGLTKSQIH